MFLCSIDVHVLAGADGRAVTPTPVWGCVHIVAVRAVVPAPDKPGLVKAGKSPVVVTRAAGMKATEVCTFLCLLDCLG